MPKKRIAPSSKKDKKKSSTHFAHNGVAPQKIKLDIKSIKTMFKKTIINKIARKTGFIKRTRKLNAYEFFISLTFGALKGSTITLSAIIENLSSKIKRASVNERFSEAAYCFMRDMYSHFFKMINTIDTSINVALFNKFRAIKVIDSSSWRLPKALKDIFPGYNESGCKIQLMIDLKTGLFSLFDITKETYNDFQYSKDMSCDIKANDLCMFDLGYLTAKALVQIQEKMAFFYHVLIQRVYHSTRKKEINSIRWIS